MVLIKKFFLLRYFILLILFFWGMTIVEWKKCLVILAKKDHKLQAILVSSHPVVKSSAQRLCPGNFFPLHSYPVVQLLLVWTQSVFNGSLSTQVLYRAWLSASGRYRYCLCCRTWCQALWFQENLSSVLWSGKEHTHYGLGRIWERRDHSWHRSIL